MKVEKKLVIFNCIRCGYSWASRYFTEENPPNACAKCKRRFWNKPTAIELAEQHGLSIIGRRKVSKQGEKK